MDEVLTSYIKLLLWYPNTRIHNGSVEFHWNEFKFSNLFFRLQPLLTEVKHDRKIIALGTLDYIQFNTLEYKYYEDYMIRYGFDWRMVFFERFFRKDQVGERPEDTRE